MTTDRFSQMEDDANTTVQGGVGLLKTVVGLSPVAAGIWFGQRKLTSNEAVKQAVIAGLGLSIMPLIGIKNELQKGDLQIIPLKITACIVNIMTLADTD